MKTLLEQIKELEVKIAVYSELDNIRTKQLEKQKRKLEMKLLDEMVKVG